MPIDPAEGAESPARLLLIDRHAAAGDDLAPILAACLTRPCPIDIAATGRRAAQMLRERSYAIVLAELSSLEDLAVETDEAVARLVRLAHGALLVALADGPSVTAAVATMRAGAHEFISRPISAAALAVRIGELARRHSKPLAAAMVGAALEPSGPPPAVPPAMHQSMLPLWRQEQQIIEDAIERFNGNVALAAAALELSPSTIYRKRQAWAQMEGRRGAA
jgi:DNA-binding NtrC family response regulator